MEIKYVTMLIMSSLGNLIDRIVRGYVEISLSIKLGGYNF